MCAEPARLALTLRQARDEAYLYRRLATLNRDSDAPGDGGRSGVAGCRAQPFEALCAELGFDSIPGRVHRWA